MDKSEKKGVKNPRQGANPLSAITFKYVAILFIFTESMNSHAYIKRLSRLLLAQANCNWSSIYCILFVKETVKFLRLLPDVFA